MNALKTLINTSSTCLDKKEILIEKSSRLLARLFKSYLVELIYERLLCIADL